MKSYALILLVAGCGGTDAAGPDANLGTAEFPVPPDGQGVQLHLGAEVAAGQERVDCRYVILPETGADALEVQRFEHHYTPGSHHMLVYPTNARAEDVDLEPFDCTSRGDLRLTGVAYGGTEPRGELVYPDGVAMRLAPGSVVMVEVHYLNTTGAALSADVRVNLWWASAPVDEEAGTIFFYDWAIHVPPAPAMATTTMRCAIPQDISLLFATSHMHRRGVAFRSHLEPVAGGEPVPLHASSSWAAPTPDAFWPPRSLAAGDVVEFSCDYHNDLPHDVVEGESADVDEMCIFIGGYWPKMSPGAEGCTLPGSGPVLDGSATCEEVVDCMLAAGVGNEVDGQQCIADTCAGSADALSQFVVCVEQHGCWGSESCVAAQCGPEWIGCVEARCD